jgi:hypothetical protein
MLSASQRDQLERAGRRVCRRVLLKQFAKAVGETVIVIAAAWLAMELTIGWRTLGREDKWALPGLVVISALIVLFQTALLLVGWGQAKREVRKKLDNWTDQDDQKLQELWSEIQAKRRSSRNDHSCDNDSSQ